MAPPSAEPQRSHNALLAKLSHTELETLRPHLKRVELPVRQVIFDANRPLSYAYFPEAGMISVVSNMENGASIEVGTVGREGMAGAFLLMDTESVPYQAYVQIEGHAQQISADALLGAAEHNRNLRNLILRYQSAFLTQSMQCAACNGLHGIQQRCCRWLLMARDRSNSDDIRLTHEFLGLMLGVRRASVTEVLQPLNEAGLVDSVRGKITILNRAGLEARSCECYRVIADQQRLLLS
jgi:CRP-like cAMP-binding protein